MKVRTVRELTSARYANGRAAPMPQGDLRDASPWDERLFRWGKSGGRGRPKLADPNSGSAISFVDATAKATGKGRTTDSADAERGKKINGAETIYHFTS
jgi:hypothetical protein